MAKYQDYVIYGAIGFMVGWLINVTAGPKVFAGLYGVAFLTTGIYTYFKWYRPRKRAKRAKAKTDHSKTQDKT